MCGKGCEVKEEQWQHLKNDVHSDDPIDTSVGSDRNLAGAPARVSIQRRSIACHVKEQWTEWDECIPLSRETPDSYSGSDIDNSRLSKNEVSVKSWDVEYHTKEQYFETELEKCDPLSSDTSCDYSGSEMCTPMKEFDVNDNGSSKSEMTRDEAHDEVLSAETTEIREDHTEDMTHVEANVLKRNVHVSEAGVCFPNVTEGDMTELIKVEQDKERSLDVSSNIVSNPEEDIDDLLKELKAKEERRREKENKRREEEDKIRKDEDERREKEDEILNTNQKNKRHGEDIEVQAIFKRSWGFSWNQTCCLQKAMQFSVHDSRDLQIRVQRTRENERRKEEDNRRKNEDEWRDAYDDVLSNIVCTHEARLNALMSKLKAQVHLKQTNEDERRKEERLLEEEEEKIRDEERNFQNLQTGIQGSWRRSCGAVFCFRQNISKDLERRSKENRIRKEEHLNREKAIIREEEERKATYTDLSEKMNIITTNQQRIINKRMADINKKRCEQLSKREEGTAVEFQKIKMRQKQYTDGNKKRLEQLFKWEEETVLKLEEITKSNKCNKDNRTDLNREEEIPVKLKETVILNKQNEDNRKELSEEDQLEKMEENITVKLKQNEMLNKQHKDHAKYISSKNAEEKWKKGNKTHIKQLTEIGNIHRQIGEIKENKLELVKAVAIYECAMVHCQHGTEADMENIRLKEKETLDLFFKQCTGTGLPKNYFEDDRENKEKLNDIRDELKQKICEIDQNQDMYNCYEPELLGIEREKREKNRIGKIKEIFEWIETKMKEFVQSLIRQCQDILDFHHNDFAFIAFGSLSRKETTPYSDVEFAVVQNSNDPNMDGEYRKKLMNMIMTLHLKFLSFGETVLPAMDIKSLNDKNDESKDWYLDLRKYVKTKQGISFDGLMPRANKTPYFTCKTNVPGNKDFCLTDTKTAFMKLFNAEGDKAVVKQLLYFFKGDFTTLFGDESIETDLKKCFKESPQREKIIQLIVEELEEDFVKHSCVKKIYDAKYKSKLIKKNQIHVKKELYRLPSVVINNLLHLIDNSITCVWDLPENHPKLNSKVIHNLKMTLSTSAEI
ncbi:unnamed protein product [Owenia fusiformis]|uniref:Uncharacterized protein n=1 Tax=Owenia fusiformis TaxID=6347 RepID=A0A8J1ULA1_OWEFU|nr:unnamed protein product [Owenia fusiformis]